MDAVSTPGTLALAAAEPNVDRPADHELYLLKGDATTAPVKAIIPEAGVKIPGLPEILRHHDFNLRIYHFNDLHGHLTRFSPQGEEPVISRMSWQLGADRETSRTDPHKAILALSAGDECIGSVFDELLGKDQVHAGYHLYSAMGLDAAVLGNHDFDRGLPLLSHSIRREVRFPILAANIRGCQELDGLVFPAAILVVKSVRVGLVGLVTRAENRLPGGDCRIFEPVQVLKNLIPVLRPNCDLLIVLSHLGYSLDAGSAQMMDAGDVELAKNLPRGGVDLIIGGHSHSVLNMSGLAPENIVNGIPIVQAGAMGRFLGKVDITLRGGRVSVTNARLIPVDSLPVNAAFDRDQVQPLIAQARDLFTGSLGRVEVDPNLATDVIQNRCATGELALANFITDAVVDRLHQSGHRVAFAMIDSSSLYSGLPVGGSLTFGDWFNVMPFADTIRLYQMTGQQLYNLLQDNARRIDRPGEPHTERGFLHFSGEVRYRIYPGEDRSRSWADEIMVNDVPLEDQLGKDYIVAGTSFIRELASQWELHQSFHPEHALFDLNGLPYSETDVFLRSELVNYIMKHGGVTKSSGARCDGRLQVVQDLNSPVTHLRVDEFIQAISHQDHAMAGAVIAISAAQAAALGQACLRISRNLSESEGQDTETSISQLTVVKKQLLQWSKRDASAIAEFVALREAGRELAGQRLLCQAPAQVGQLSIEAADLLQLARSTINDRVKDDLEISISLLTSAAQAARLLLDSNLRIWPEPALLAAFEPVLAELTTGIETLQPVKKIRN